MIEELKYRVFENIGQERPDVEEMTNKINELIEEVNKLRELVTPSVN